MAVKRAKPPSRTSVLLKNGIFIKNPVLTAGLAVTPVVSGGFALKAGVAFSVINAVLLIATTMILWALGSRIPQRLKPIAAPLLAAVLYIPIAWFFCETHPTLAQKIGIFLPLLVMDSILLVRGCEIASRKKKSTALLDAAANAVGFGLVMCIMSALREILTQSTLWGQFLPWGQHIPMAALPFAGLILLGLLAAFFRWVRGEKHRYWDSPLTPSKGGDKA